MRKLTVSLFAGLAAVAVSGAVVAQDRTAPRADLTRAGVQERAALAFQRMDANGDGKIDAADREARVKARFDRIDANNDGTIDFAEYTAQRAPRENRSSDARGERRPQRGERMGHGRMHGGGMGMRGMGRGADSNGDGSISRAEFETAALARFDAADADSNGTVTAAERKAHRDDRRSKARQHRTPGAD